VPRGLFANPNKRKRDEDSEHTPPTCEHTERLYTGRQGVNSSELPVENRIFQTGTPGKTQRTEEACCSGRTELPINVLQSEAKEDWILGPRVSSWAAAKRYQSLFPMQSSSKELEKRY
jgi:hypothetical protein